MLTLILGPMFSGKTSELIRLLVRASIAGKKVILLRPETDNRGFLTHDGKGYELEERFVSYIDIEEYEDYDVIGIEEGQFFDANNHEFKFIHAVNVMCNDDQEVIISALNGTSERQEFPIVSQLIPHAEHIIKLNAVCTMCGSDDGAYSFYRKGDKHDKIKVGDIHDYTALCRKCYVEQFRE